MFENQDKLEGGMPFRWKCPVTGCKKDISGWSEVAVKLSRDVHVIGHERDSLEAMTAYAAAFEKRPKHDPNILRLTRSDIGFLRTRLVKLDDDWERDIDDDPKNYPGFELTVRETGHSDYPPRPIR